MNFRNEIVQRNLYNKYFLGLIKKKRSLLMIAFLEISSFYMRGIEKRLHREILSIFRF